MITIALFAPAMRPDLQIPGIEAKINALPKVFARFEALLGESEYVAGPSPTIADIVCYCEIGQCSVEMFGLFDLSKYPNILGWMERCKQIPGYTQAHELCYQIAPMVRAKVQTFNSLNSKL
eukprot:TRINITY_DN10822_c0_g1_i1.p1 TRINITY_DN10822_c0_g1~~TRINITY_DN10822_c0_g1_i1.p1  ORF type:complete len:121 (-),score=12.75 TRINITY_DN10822_c0_g1_i1:299-661(-)